MRRMRTFDYVVLVTLGPLFAVWFGLSTLSAVAGRFAEPSVYVAFPGHPDQLPRLVEVQAGTPAVQSGLRPGDLLQRIGDADLRGTGPIGFFARALHQMDAAGGAEVHFVRDGRELHTRLEYVRLPLPARLLLVPLCFALTGLGIILRAPRSRTAGAIFRAFLIASFALLRPWGGPPAQTYAIAVTFFAVAGLAAPALVHAAQVFPSDLRGPGRFSRILPWLFIPVGPVYVCGTLGVTFLGDANYAFGLAMWLLNGIGIVILGILTRNYRRCDPLGRRKMRWAILGIYLSVAPILLATFISISTAELWWLSDASEIFLVGIPAALFVAIVRYNLLDIDRLISATASYSLLLGALLVAGVTALPSLAQAAERLTGISASSSQVAFAVALAAAVLPAERWLRPLIDRGLFPAAHALDEELHLLLLEMPGLETPAQLTARIGERIDELFRPESCVVYARAPEGYVPVFARGRAVPPVFDAGHRVVRILETRGSPLAAEGWSKGRSGTPLTRFERALLETLDAALLIPVLQGQSLLAFLCLGPKRSGDVYTSSERVLLGVTAQAAAGALRRFDDVEMIRQGREMQKAYRRYVPEAVAEELASGGGLESGEREVSVLFVDLRGYSSYSEGRAVGEVFGTINRYTEAVSAVVRKHGGSVVEFNGDGMMAVFGAPRELEAKEQSALETALELVSTVGRIEVPGQAQHLSVGVGVATGPAFVGNIRAVDRLIWSAIGSTTNLAARMQALTRPLEAAVVTDPETWTELDRPPAGFERRRGVAIAGLSETHDLYVLPLAGLEDSP